MDTSLSIHELATLTDEKLQHPLRNEELCTAHKRALQRCFKPAGLTGIRSHAVPNSRHVYLLTASSSGGRSAVICMPPVAETPMGLRSLSTAECDACDDLMPGRDIYYASFFADPAQKKLLLAGPVLVRRADEWLGDSEKSAQFLPTALRGENTQLTPLLGGAALFKMQDLLIPYTLTHGELPQFSVHGLFEDRAQGGGSCFYALLGGAPPTHMMLVRRNDSSRNLEFTRPFFFYGDAPDSELVLKQNALLEDAPESGLIELSTVAGTTLYAECVESVLFPGALTTDRRYRWTLSLVADSCDIVRQRKQNLTRSLLRQVREDFRREHGSEPPADFSFALPNNDDFPSIQQETLTSYTTLTARVLSCVSVLVDGVPAQHWRVQLLPAGEEVTLHVFVGSELVCSPAEEDIIRLSGHLHASPDVLLPASPPPQQPEPLVEVPQPLTEEQACRILCNAVCTHEWDDFIANSRADLTYHSHMNGTQLKSRQEFIRYMSERRQLWRRQHSFQGMCWDTGSIIYRGEKRHCYMLSCFGQMVGASILTLQDSMIASIETLPEETNASFSPDQESSSAPRIFHPFRGHLTPHPAEHTPLQLFTANYLRECMVQKTGYCAPNAEEAATKRGCARWIKLTRDEPTCCDMAFAHRGRVYAVCTVEVPKHPDHGGSIAEAVEALPEREQLLALAEQHGLIPCIFPAERQYSPEPAKSWNLWDMRSLQPLQPEQVTDTDATPPPSVWEVLVGALAELRVRVQRAGGTVIAYHDTPKLFPHFWFRDPQGTLSWVILRCSADPAQQDRSLSEQEMLPQELAPGTQGYLATATAYGDEACSKPARRGEPMYVKLSALMPLSC